jgi:hypothetical protein
MVLQRTATSQLTDHSRLIYQHPICRSYFALEVRKTPLDRLAIPHNGHSIPPIRSRVPDTTLCILPKMALKAGSERRNLPPLPKIDNLLRWRTKAEQLHSLFLASRIPCSESRFCPVNHRNTGDFPAKG